MAFDARISAPALDQPLCMDLSCEDFLPIEESLIDYDDRLAVSYLVKNSQPPHLAEEWSF
ncbi:hypothetical protein [Mangrovicoccus algicola]|uniref:Uncharacterized protein n=1 Tax=Mangrovicoccus algicola TaxID=2771008 RepID=A0A8J6Z7M3_9RHOB|nr:hypothetical protein [Mangrovicoccus algicola]MBE3637346.1 hypothetical protein [Mangrovicoccus algicola]